MIAIWGANGFIGRHLTNHLLSSDNNRSPVLFSRDFKNFPFSLPYKIQTFECDFSKLEDYIEHLKDCRVAVLLVSASSARTFSHAPEQENYLNVAPYQNFLECTRQLPALEHIVYASSGGAIYGMTAEQPIPEDHPLAPLSPYGKGKLAIEDLIKETAASSSWDYTILRIANPVGIWARNNNLVDAALNAARENTPISVWGDGRTVRDYFDVRELAEAITMVIENAAARNQTFNVGSGQGYSINDVIHAVESITGKKIDIRYSEAPNAEIPYNVLCCHKIEDKIGWKASKDLYDILEDMTEAKT